MCGGVVPVLRAAERNRKADGARLARLVKVGGQVEQIRKALVASQLVIDLCAELVRGFLRGPVRRKEVVVDIGERPGRCRLVRHDHVPRHSDVGAGQRAESADGNPVVRERIANEPGAIRVRSARRRVVDNQPVSVLVNQIGEVTVPHFRRRHAQKVGRGVHVIEEAFVGREEERLVTPL